MSPAELLADHQRAPRNLGKMLNPHAVGDVGSIVVGDALRFYIQAQDGRITAARFQVFNAQDQVGPASAVTELAAGRSLDAAAALTIGDLCDHLGGLPVEALPVRIWGLEGLRAAIAALRGEELPVDEERPALLCRCHGIAEETVRQSIAVMDLADVDAVVAATGAGSGCGSCRADIPRLIDEVRNRPAAAPASGQGGGGGARGRIALVRRIAGAVDAGFAPVAAQRGVRLDLVDLDGALVVVRMTGADEEVRRALAGELEAFLKREVEASLGVRLAG